MPKTRRWAAVAVALAVLAAAGCSRDVDTPAIVAAAVDSATPRLQIGYPQEGTIFPPDIVAPTFLWEDETAGADRWHVVVRDDAGAEVLRQTVDSPRWRPAPADWTRIKERSAERDAEVTIAGFQRERGEAPLSAGQVRIRTSKDPVGDSLLYREVPLPFLTAVQDPSRIRWRYGSVDLEDGPPIILQNLPVCGNCHSFADNGSVLGLDVDYGNDKGAYGLVPVSTHMVMDDDKIITWSDYKRDDGELTFGLLSRVSPTGRYVVSTVKDRSVFVAIPDLMISQLFFPIKGILVVYDRETETFAPLPGADDPRYVQTNAVWSPDGTELIFARATAHHSEHLEQKNSALVDEKDVPEFTVDKQPFLYDLYRIPFNDGKGGTPVPLAGASANGMSNYFPKYPFLHSRPPNATQYCQSGPESWRTSSWDLAVPRQRVCCSTDGSSRIQLGDGRSGTFANRLGQCRSTVWCGRRCGVHLPGARPSGRSRLHQARSRRGSPWNRGTDGEYRRRGEDRDRRRQVSSHR